MPRNGLASLGPGLSEVEVMANKQDGSEIRFTASVRIDTPVEIEYYRNGGILQKVLRDLA